MGLQALHHLLIASNSTFNCFYTLRFSIEFLLRKAASTLQETKTKTLRKPIVLTDGWRQASLLSNCTNSSRASCKDLRLPVGTSVALQLKTDHLSCQQGCSPGCIAQDWAPSQAGWSRQMGSGYFLWSTTVHPALL